MNNSSILPINQPQISQIQVQQPIPPAQSNIPYKVTQVRLHFGFGNYSPIMSDEEDAANDDKNKEDLVGNLLNEL